MKSGWKYYKCDRCGYNCPEYRFRIISFNRNSIQYKYRQKFCHSCKNSKYNKSEIKYISKELEELSKKIRRKIDNLLSANRNPEAEKRRKNRSNKNWADKNRERYRKNKRAFYNKQVINISNLYIKHLLAQKLKLSYKEIPDNLIKIKKKQLKLYRDVKQKEKSTKSSRS